MNKLLDKILLSHNVVEDFYKEYNTNIEFKVWLDKTIREIKLCEQLKQNNPWHIYNVLGHILHSVEVMNKQSKDLPLNDRRILAYTMLFHDIGKPEKHITRQKDGVIIDSFFDHNIASENIAKLRLPNLKFSNKEIEIISKLVFKHDIFMFIKYDGFVNRFQRRFSKELVLDEIEDMSSLGDGVKYMKYLVMVGRADNLAQNPEKTADSLKLLTKFDEVIDSIEQTKNI